MKRIYLAKVEMVAHMRIFTDLEDLTFLVSREIVIFHTYNLFVGELAGGRCGEKCPFTGAD